LGLLFLIVVFKKKAGKCSIYAGKLSLSRTYSNNAFGRSVIVLNIKSRKTSDKES
jgi:hypothetical protein